MNLWFENNEGKRMALVLGGGGARGCYEIGAWQAFKDNGLTFDIVTGTSIGALVGAIYVQQTLEPLEQFVLTLKPTHIATDLFAFPESFESFLKDRHQIASYMEKYILSSKGMDISPLRSAIDEMFKYDLFKKSPIEFACMTYNLTKREPRAFFKDQMTAENANQIILASASCYPAFPMLEMDGDYYIDGGYYNNLPVDLAMELKADKYLVLDVEGPGLVQPWPKDLDLLLVKPMLPLGNFLDFTSAQGLRSMHIGYLEISKLLGRFEGYLYTFVSGSSLEMEYLNGCLSFLFMVKGIPVSDTAIDRIFSSLVGFHPSSLSKRCSQESLPFEQMLEALAYVVGVEPVMLYSYTDFLITLVEKLHSLKQVPIERKDKPLIEWLFTLKKEDVLQVVHQILKAEGLVYKDYMNAFRIAFPSEFYLAWMWCFVESIYERLL